MQTYHSQAQLQALGDVTRQMLVERLRAGPLPVVELARGISISRPAVSQHLRVLKRASLVSDRAVGTRRFYELDPRGFATLRAYLDRFWDEALASFQSKVEEG